MVAVIASLIRAWSAALTGWAAEVAVAGGGTVFVGGAAVLVGTGVAVGVSPPQAASTVSMMLISRSSPPKCSFLIKNLLFRSLDPGGLSRSSRSPGGSACYRTYRTGTITEAFRPVRCLVCAGRALMVTAGEWTEEED